MAAAPLLFLSLQLFFSLFAAAADMDCDSEDRAALLRIKSELGDPPELSTWQTTSANCCAWSNLYCTAAGRVYNVYFIEINVSSQVPAGFGDLRLLQIIQIDAMPGLTGPIPRSFAKLPDLELLKITGTSVSGSIPDDLAALTNLRALFLSGNKLAGAIPATLSRLPKLRFIDLSGNALSGTIPAGLLHGEFRFLDLSDNRLTGTVPEDYGDGDIDTIDLSNNRLSGDPSCLFSIDKPTKKLDLSANKFAFELRKTTMFPHHLTYLNLSRNHITGRVPKSIMDLSQLRHLDLSYNELCGEIPTGRYMSQHAADSYQHNRCLCGTPLPPCLRH